MQLLYASLSFRLGLQKAHMLQILALPAKRVGFFAVSGALIARSDSNGEDLEAFAGAGKPFYPCALYHTAVVQSEMSMC